MEDDQVISQGDANQPGVPDKGQGNKDDYVPLTKDQEASLRRELGESRQSEQAWANFHRNGGANRTAAEPVNELPDPREFEVEGETQPGIEDDTPEKLVNDFAATGVAALSKRGFITAADALKLARQEAIKISQEMIGRNNQKSAADQRIVNEFADLKKPDSELFKATALIYREAVEMDPGAAKTPAALFLAAKAAKAQLASAKRDRAADDQPGDAGETADDRRRRADSQDGSRSRGRADSAADDMLGAEAREIIKGFGISEAEFKEQRQATRTAGRGARR